MSAAIRIGTSGWYYKHWVGPFYPPKTPAARLLDYYSERFDTVEINNSFYRLPPETALTNWRDATPPDFCFAMKGSRFLTHMKKLKDAGQGLDRFFERADLLGPKLGPILFQLPPHWTLNLERLDTFLKALPSRHRYAFEFRDPTWLTNQVYDLLSRRRAALCIFDLAGFQSPIEVTTRFTYIRLHGPGGKYQGSYSDASLEAWADRIRTWSTTLEAIYVYFDNDQSGYAAEDALRLGTRISGLGRTG